MFMLKIPNQQLRDAFPLLCKTSVIVTTASVEEKGLVVNWLLHHHMVGVLSSCLILGLDIEV